MRKTMCRDSKDNSLKEKTISESYVSNWKENGFKLSSIGIFPSDWCFKTWNNNWKLPIVFSEHMTFFYQQTYTRFTSTSQLHVICNKLNVLFSLLQTPWHFIVYFSLWSINKLSISLWNCIFFFFFTFLDKQKWYNYLKKQRAFKMGEKKD